MQENPSKQRQWVRQPPNPPVDNHTSSTTQTAIHPQQRVIAQADTWLHIWNQPHPADSAGKIHDPWTQTQAQHQQLLQAWLPQHTLAAPAIDLTAQDLITAARQCRGKVAGGDGWTAEALLALPTPWWDCFAQLWRAILSSAVIPVVWTQTLVVLLTKPNGGTRPISITGLCWRIGASAVVRSLASWTHTWAVPELCGGLPGRDGMALHARLFHDLMEHKQDDFTLLSQDLSKAFDTVSIPQVLSVFGHMGAPPQLCTMIL